MKVLRNLLPIALLLSGTGVFAASSTTTTTERTVAAAPTVVMKVSYWGYITLPPVMIGLFVVNGWLVRRKV